MLSYCLKCRQNQESKNPKVVKTRDKTVMLLSEWAMCNSKKSKFLKDQEAKGLLSSIRIRTPLIPLLGRLLF